MPLFRDEYPLLSPNQAVDEGYGIETNAGSKVVGAFEDILFQQGQQAIPTAGSITAFIAPYPLELIGGSLVWSTASASGTVQLTKDTGTTAPGAGTALLTAAIATSTTANTVANFGSVSYAGAAGTAFASPATSGKVQMAKGDRLSITFGGTFTSQTNLVVMGFFKRI